MFDIFHRKLLENSVWCPSLLHNHAMNSKMNLFKRLPDPILMEIFRQCEGMSQFALLATCKEFHSLRGFEKMWQEIATELWQANVKFPIGLLTSSMGLLENRIEWIQIAYNLSNPSGLGQSYQVWPFSNVTIGVFHNGGQLLGRQTKAVRIFRNGDLEYGNWLSTGTGKGLQIRRGEVYHGAFHRNRKWSGRISDRRGCSYDDIQCSPQPVIDSLRRSIQ